MTVTLLLITASVLLQHLRNQHHQLANASQITTRLLDHTLETAEQLLLSLADDLLHSSPPALDRLQQRMHHAVRFNNSFQRLLLVENGRIRLDSQQNRRIGHRFTPAQPPSAHGYSPGLYLAHASAELPGIAGALQAQLQLPDTPSHNWTLVLILDTDEIQQLFNTAPLAGKHGHGLLTQQGDPLLMHMPVASWPQQVTTLVQRHIEHSQQYHWQGLLPTQRHHFQHSHRFPLVTVQSLDYADSMLHWAQQHLVLLLILLASATMTLLLRRIPAANRQVSLATPQMPEARGHTTR